MLISRTKLYTTLKGLIFVPFLHALHPGSTKSKLNGITSWNGVPPPDEACTSRNASLSISTHRRGTVIQHQSGTLVVPWWGSRVVPKNRIHTRFGCNHTVQLAGGQYFFRSLATSTQHHITTAVRKRYEFGTGFAGNTCR